MIRFSKQVKIHDFAEVIWNIMVDVEHWNEWTISINRIKKLTTGSFSKGTRLLIEQPNLPEAVWKVSEIKEGKSFTMAKGNFFLKVIAGHTLEPVSDGTLVTLSLEFSGLFAKWVAEKYRSLMEEYLAAEAAGLKKESESNMRMVF
jgi:hypothetical protein